MRFFSAIAFFALIVCSCGNPTNSSALKDSLDLRNKQVDSLVRRLKVKDDSLKLIKSLSDSVGIISDTTGMYKPELAGHWTVTMRCIETSCEGSALGDVKNEEWEISYEGSTLIARAITGNKVTRVYRGFSRKEHIELKSSEETANTTMTVRLQQGKASQSLEGVREIIRGEECRIRYAVSLVKN